MVQGAIVKRLAGDDPAAQGRIRFSTMGAGFSCLVGDSRVFCTHGNEVDPWNFVRYEDLAKAGRRLNCGRTLKPDEWEPNAGTKIVKDIMNVLKVRYPWIDLLKPEIKGAVGVLLALDPGQMDKIDSIIPIIGEKMKGDREFDQRLSADGFAAPAHKGSRPTVVYDLLGPNLTAGLQGCNRSTADDLLLAAEKEYQNGTAATDPDDETLGVGQYIWDRLTGWLTGVGKAEALRRALKDWLKDDKTFEPTDQDDTCRETAASVGQDVHFLITGHTHLERAIDLGGDRFYFNCGTWIRLMRFTEGMLEKGRMPDIDQAVFDGNPFVLPRQSAVCIRSEAEKMVGELAHIEGAEPITRNIIKRFER